MKNKTIKILGIGAIFLFVMMIFVPATSAVMFNPEEDDVDVNVERHKKIQNTYVTEKEIKWPDYITIVTKVIIIYEDNTVEIIVHTTTIPRDPQEPITSE